MITIVSGTNRQSNKTLIFAKQYLTYFKEMAQEEVHFIDLCDVPADMLHTAMYSPSGQFEALTALQDRSIIPASKFFFVFPEYNGSFPGILKLFIDAISIREYGPTFKNKKAGLCGVASGRAGNLRGIDHLTGVLHHVGTQVMPRMLPISGIGQLLDKEHRIQSTDTLEAMKAFTQAFIEY